MNHQHDAPTVAAPTYALFFFCFIDYSLQLRLKRKKSKRKRLFVFFLNFVKFDLFLCFNLQKIYIKKLIILQNDSISFSSPRFSSISLRFCLQFVQIVFFKFFKIGWKWFRIALCNYPRVNKHVFGFPSLFNVNN